MRKLLNIACLLVLALPTLAQRNILSDISARARSQMIPGQRDLRLQPGARPGSYKLFVLTSQSANEMLLDSEQVFGLGKQLAIQAKRVNSRTAFQSIAFTRNSALPASDAPGAINITDPFRSGVFVLRPGDTTTPDDGALYLRTQNNLLYARDIPDRRIIPDMFGAIPNDGIDDAIALVAWASAKGWSHFLPDDNTYDCSVNLNRTNKGRFTLNGRGTINFSGDSDGLRVVNILDGGYYGTISIQGPTFNSTGIKSTGREALRIESQHEGPSPVVRDVKITSLELNKEWSTGIHLHDCSNAVVEACDVQGASLSVCTGFLVTNTPNRPAVNPAFKNCNVRNLYRGYSFIGLGYPALEGISASGGEIVNAFQGIYGSTEYDAPLLKIDINHVNTFGGECLYLTGYNQVFINGGSWYANTNANTGQTPTQGIYINKVTFLQAKLAINLVGNIANAVYLDGSGGLVDMDIAAGVTQGESNVVYVSGGYGGSLFGNSRQWTGAAGNNIGGNITGPGKATSRIKFFAHPDSQFPSEGDILRYSGGLYRAVTSNNLVQGQFPNSRATNLSSITADVPSGYYTYSGTTGVPSDPSGFNNWLWNKNRLENGSNSGDRWSGDYIVNLKTKRAYFGGYDAQTGSMAPWKLALTTPDVPIVGDLFYYDGADFKRIPKGTDGQTLKMVGGLPAWSN